MSDKTTSTACPDCRREGCSGDPRFKGMCSLKGVHDRGAFGSLIAEARALGVRRIRWDAFLDLPDESAQRWAAGVTHGEGRAAEPVVAHGRTGEEALRGLVEKLRGLV